MSNKDKLLNKMRRNPRDWRIGDFEKLAKQYGITVRKPRGSHVVLTHPEWVEHLCVPAHRAIKPIYVKKFLSLLEIIGVNDNENS